MSEPAETATDETSTHIRTCPLCEATCGLELTVKGGEVTRVRGDRDDVFSKGFICPKGSVLGHLHNDPDRLRTPLIKRDGGFIEASWDEAFAAISDGLAPLQEKNRDAVALYLGNPNVHTFAGMAFNPALIKALGSKNVFSASTLDQMPKHVSSGLMFGNPNTIPVPDLDRCDYLLMLGANPYESNGSLCTAPDFPGRLEAIISRGGSVVTVATRVTKTTENSTQHLQITPGTDALWLAALITELVDAAPTVASVLPPHLVDHVAGLEAAIASLAPFDADTVAQRCGIDAETTREVARRLDETPRAAVYGRIGTHTTEFGTLASWLVDLANLVSGNLDTEGGAMFALPAHGAPDPDQPGGRGFRTGRWHSRVSQHPEVRGEIPAAALAEEIETPGDGQVKALICIAGNPALSAPESERLDAAFAGLDFMVSVDIYLNETSRHADVILPPPSPLAKAHVDLAFYGLSVRNVFNYSEPLMGVDHPSQQGMEEHEIYARLTLIASGSAPDTDPEVIYDLIEATLASRSGVELDDDQSYDHLAERFVDLMVRGGPYEDLSIAKLKENPHGIDLGALQPRLPNALKTTSGKVEAGPAELLADLERLAAVLTTPLDTSELLLVGRRHLRSNNSWMHNVRQLTKGKPRCTLQVNPSDAERFGITDAAPTMVRSRVGEVSAVAEVTTDVPAGTVSLPHGWGHSLEGTSMANAEANAGVNSNVLTDGSRIDPLSGNAQLNAIPVKISAS